MTSSPRIDIATVADIPGLAALRMQQQWWERGERLLRPLLAWDGARIFVVRAGALDLPLAPPTTPETPIGVVGAIAAGATGVIGNVVVRAEYQRRGLAHQLLSAALDWQRDRGVRTSWLDATIAGRSLYRSLGYQDTEPSYFASATDAMLQWQPLRVAADGLVAHLAPAEALERVAALDTAAYGGDRMPLLRGVLAEPETWLYLADDAAGDPLGYLMARSLEPPQVGIQIGAWVARSHEAAAALLNAVLAEDAPWRAIVASSAGGAQPPEIHLSPPGNNPATLTLLRTVGVEITLDDLIMRLDFADEHGDIHPAPQRVEWLYGWLAAMVF